MTVATGARGPLVSVVIPTYERPHYLREAVASVVAQSHRALEIIVHDNASPTDPASVLAGFADPRIVLYRNERNLGVTRNIAAGIARCRGEYLALLGDDDLWHPDFVATLAAALDRHEDAVVAFCDHDIVDREGRVDEALSAAVTHRYGRDVLAAGLHRPFGEIALIRRSICIMSGALLRRSATDWADLPAEVALGTDLYIAYLAARTGRACHYTPLRLAHYRYHTSSLSTAVRGDMEARIGNARAALYYWNRFLRDAGLARERRYFEMKRGWSALLIVLCLARRGAVRSALGELRGFLGRGLIRPRLVLYHLLYAWRLGRARI